MYTSTFYVLEQRKKIKIKMFDEDPDTRSRVLKINNGIARCAKRKELTQAFVLYENAVREGSKLRSTSLQALKQVRS